MKATKNLPSIATAIRIVLLLAVGAMSFAGVAKAQIIGALQFTQYATGASFTANTFTLPDELILSNAYSNPASPSGIFSGLAGDTVTIITPDSSSFLPLGVSTNPTAPSIVRSIPLLSFGNFTFDLTSIYMTNSDPSNPNMGTASVLGSGILLDSANSSTYLASFSASDVLSSGPVIGVFAASAVPEPSSIGLAFFMVLPALIFLRFWNRRGLAHFN
jgi:hypothetical protein